MKPKHTFVRDAVKYALTPPKQKKAKAPPPEPEPEVRYKLDVLTLTFTVGAAEWAKLDDAALDVLCNELDEVTESARDAARFRIEDNPKLRGIVKVE